MKKAKFAGARIIQDGKILLVQEAHKEALGLWSLPLGNIEESEVDEETAIREAKEETGFSVSLGDRIKMEIPGHEFKSTSSFSDLTIDLTIFAAKIENGVIQKGDDVMDVRWFPLNDAVQALPLRGGWVRELILSD